MTEESPLLTAGAQLRDRWEVLKKIGGGGFGEIYKVIDQANGQIYAAKVESCTSTKQVLKMEVAVLKRLQGTTAHVCDFIACGRNDVVNYVVMTLLGPSLSELRKRQPNQHFSISTTLRIGVQIIEAVRAIHDCGFLHRDIKPSNFAIGGTPATSRTCVMLDFGLSRQYTTLTGEVRQPRPIAGFRGTVRYASINAHQSIDLGRHDDLWSVFYMLAELSAGQLPWRKIRDKEEAGVFKYKYDHKKLISMLPFEFEAFLEHLKSLSYFDKPNYWLLINLLKTAMKNIGVHQSDLLDWENDFSAPSLTTVSVASPVAFGTPEKNEEKKESSKTNCSEVEELKSNELQMLKVDADPQEDSIVDNEVAPDLNRELSDVVEVENKYESEEESESHDQDHLQESGSHDQDHLQVPLTHHRVTNIIVAEDINGVSPIKSFQTESLNRFFDQGPADNESRGKQESVSSPDIHCTTDSLDSPKVQQEPLAVLYSTETESSCHTDSPIEGPAENVRALNIADSISEGSHGVQQAVVKPHSHKQEQMSVSGIQVLPCSQSSPSKTLTNTASPGKVSHDSQHFNSLVIGTRITISETKVRVLPQPPSIPLPTNYQSNVTARRRRFIRTNGT